MTPTQLQLRVAALRERRAAAAADRAAFEERRKHGLRARHQAKLARLAARTTNDSEETQQDHPTTEEPAKATTAEHLPAAEPAIDDPGTEAA